jgi:cell division transport system ATP-binding protein
MIQFSHIYKTYPGPVHALRDVDIKIGRGEFIFLTGPSGSGKTTLFRLLSAYDRPTSGVVTVSGYNLHELNSSQVPLYRRQIGVVFQDFRLLKDRTVFENVLLPLQIRGEAEGDGPDRVHEILNQVGLSEKHDAHPEHLSGGEQQRVAIARAIVHRPGLLIADEPTGNLDPQLSEEIMDLFERVNQQGTTLFIATHDQEMVRRRRHRCISIQNGIMKDLNQ